MTSGSAASRRISGSTGIDRPLADIDATCRLRRSGAFPRRCGALARVSGYGRSAPAATPSI
jgi:hypothetical protein